MTDNPINRHPLSSQPCPPEPGEYWVSGFPGDAWRVLRWSGEAFRLGCTAERWWAWRVVEGDA